jgi:polyferredoxin
MKTIISVSQDPTNHNTSEQEGSTEFLGKEVGGNLLRRRIIGGLLKARYFPIALQALALAFFLFLLISGFGIYPSDSRKASYLGNTNWVTLFIWGLWWPLVVYSSVFLGRVWCAFCPLELASTLATKVGLGLRLPWRKNSAILCTVTYLGLVLFGIIYWEMDLIPGRTAIYLIVLLAAALLTGILFQKRSFCNVLCPVGQLLGVHAWCAPMEWRVEDPRVCAECREKPCLSRSNYTSLLARSCTSDLYPARLATNQDCLLCTQCAKSCNRNNLRLSFRRWFADVFSGQRVSIATMAFSIVLSGFFLYELGTLWRPTRNILFWFPDSIIQHYDFSSHWAIGMIRGSIILILYPAILWLAPAAMNRIFRRGYSILEYFEVTAAAYFPIFAGIHLTIGLQDTAPRIKYIPLALRDPDGVKTAALLVSRTVKLSNQIPPFWNNTINVLQFAFVTVGLVVGIFAALRIARRNPAISPAASISAVVLYGGIFWSMILIWKWL